MTATTDATAFLAAICAEPDEDTHRLVYADWLQEQGDGARAEFIRVQCELARTPATLWVPGPAPRVSSTAWTSRSRPDPRHIDLCRRERELLDAPAEAHDWFDLPGVRTAGPRSRAGRFEWHGWWYTDDRDSVAMMWRLQRGFIAELKLRAADWLAHADALVWHPTQTQECPGCRGLGSTRVPRPYPGGWDVGVCPSCGGTPSYSGTGRVPRPCPATAQPVTRVVLTTVPEYAMAGWGLDERTFMSSQWPGVTFELPPPVHAG